MIIGTSDNTLHCTVFNSTTKHSTSSGDLPIVLQYAIDEVMGRRGKDILPTFSHDLSWVLGSHFPYYIRVHGSYYHACMLK